MDIYRFFDAHGIAYDRHDHPAVFTCEEADRLVPPLPAAKTKNIFLCDRKGQRHFLVVVGYEKRVDLRALSERLDVRKLRLASPQRLKKYLGLDPGSVTLLGVLNDPNGAVEVIVDEDLWAAETFQCHPLVNTSTVVISRGDIQRIMDITGHRVCVRRVPGMA